MNLAELGQTNCIDGCQCVVQFLWDDVSVNTNVLRQHYLV